MWFTTNSLTLGRMSSHPGGSDHVTSVCCSLIVADADNATVFFIKGEKPESQHWAEH